MGTVLRALLILTSSVLSHLYEGNIVSPIVKMKNLRHREVKYLAPGHTANKWQNQDSNLGGLALGFSLLIIHYKLLPWF